MDRKTRAILKSFHDATPLCGDIEDICAFNKLLLGQTGTGEPLNFEQKLGHLYEDALTQLIESSNKLSLIERGVQVFDDDKKTIGELDFVIKDEQSDRYIHLELAVKFYLAVPTQNGWRYPGPDIRDNWPRKLNRMRQHQFVLSKHSLAQALLNKKFGIDKIEAQQLIYGAFFYPINAHPETLPRPEHTLERKRVGQWLFSDEWNTYFPDTKEVLFIPKTLWPLPLTQENMCLFEPTSVEHFLKDGTDRCKMFTFTGESRRYFLVPSEYRKKFKVLP